MFCSFNSCLNDTNILNRAHNVDTLSFVVLPRPTWSWNQVWRRIFIQIDPFMDLERYLSKRRSKHSFWELKLDKNKVFNNKSPWHRINITTYQCHKLIPVENWSPSILKIVVKAPEARKIHDPALKFHLNFKKPCKMLENKKKILQFADNLASFIITKDSNNERKNSHAT